MLPRASGLLLLTLSITRPAWGQALVEGVVHQSNDHDVAGAMVTLRREDGHPSGRTTTGNNGEFRFFPVEAGAYTLSVSANGFYGWSYSFVARGRQPLSIEIELTPRQTINQTIEVRSAYRAIHGITI